MKISLISIGNELLNGRTKEANLYSLGQILGQKGLRVSASSTIPDCAKSLASSLDKHLADNDIVFISGGLGPTKDDLTKDIISDYFQAPLSDSEDARKLAIKHYARWGKECDFETNKYHLIPSGSRPLLNPNGMAPAIEISKNDKKVFLLPGVPKEFTAICENIIAESSWQGDSHRFTLRTCYLPEEVLFFKKFPGLWEKLEVFGKVASLPHILGVDIIIEAQIRPEQKEATRNALFELCQKEGLSEHIWSYDNSLPEEIFMQKLISKGQTFSCAESCTGGLIANKCTNLPGSSQFFMGGIISYSNASKQELLEVSSQSLKENGAVSEEVVKEMVLGVQKKFHTDFAVATSGIAGPTGGSKQKPVGMLAMGLASSQGIKTKIFQFKGDREQLKERFARAAFFELLHELKEWPLPKSTEIQ